MPAPQLPWFKFWKGATLHGKVRQLDDGTFRTWVELLDLSAQQPWRGRFVSRAEAAAISRRPSKHIAVLIAAKLIDEDPDEHLTMHDWDEWQRWRKDDANDTRTTTESPRERPSNDSRTTTERPSRTKEKRDVDVDRDEDVDEVPPAAPQQPPKGRRRVTAVGDEFIAELEAQFAEAFGSRAAVRDVIDTALSHKARLKCTDQQAYLRGWVRRDAQRLPAARRGAATVPGDAAECTCDEVRANLAISRNAYRNCDLHGRVE